MEILSCKNDIINRALSILREQDINFDSLLDPKTASEKVVNLWFDTCHCDCLIDILPPFAKKRKQLEKSGYAYTDTLNPFEKKEPDNKTSFYPNNWLNIFDLPLDCLYILKQAEQGEKREGNKIYSFRENYNLEYISSDETFSKKDIKFNLALSYYLAFYISSQITNNFQLTQYLEQEKLKYCSEARTFYMREDGIKIIKNNRWQRW